MADLYAAISDDATNRIINFLHARAPYLFNYVAPSIKYLKDDLGFFAGVEDNWICCSEVAPEPPPGIPRYRRIPALQLPGLFVKLPCSIQLIDVNIDFHPSNLVRLPIELTPPIAEQRFSIHAVVQFGIPCMPPAIADPRFNYAFLTDRPEWFSVLPVENFTCFLIQIFAVGYFNVDTSGAVQKIKVELDKLEIVDVAPSGLEHAIECYITALLKGAILPELVLAIQAIPIKALGLTSVIPSLTEGLPDNPAIEYDELRVWLDLDFK